MVRNLGIRYRDAIMLDPAIPLPFPASILVREKAIIVNLEAVRMIVCANQVYVLSVPKVRAVINQLISLAISSPHKEDTRPVADGSLAAV